MIKYNLVLAQYIDSIESGTLVKHDNLRDPDWSLFHDVKHIKKRSIPKFVRNLKQGLRFALDIPPTHTEKFKLKTKYAAKYKLEC